MIAGSAPRKKSRQRSIAPSTLASLLGRSAPPRSPLPSPRRGWGRAPPHPLHTRCPLTRSAPPSGGPATSPRAPTVTPSPAPRAPAAGARSPCARNAPCGSRRSSSAGAASLAANRVASTAPPRLRRSARRARSAQAPAVPGSVAGVPWNPVGSLGILLESRDIRGTAGARRRRLRVRAHESRARKRAAAAEAAPPCFLCATLVTRGPVENGDSIRRAPGNQPCPARPAPPRSAAARTARGARRAFGRTPPNSGRSSPARRWRRGGAPSPSPSPTAPCSRAGWATPPTAGLWAAPTPPPPTPHRGAAERPPPSTRPRGSRGAGHWGPGRVHSRAEHVVGTSWASWGMLGACFVGVLGHVVGTSGHVAVLGLRALAGDPPRVGARPPQPAPPRPLPRAPVARLGQGPPGNDPRYLGGESFVTHGWPWPRRSGGTPPSTGARRPPRASSPAGSPPHFRGRRSGATASAPSGWDPSAGPTPPPRSGTASLGPLGSPQGHPWPRRIGGRCARRCGPTAAAAARRGSAGRRRGTPASMGTGLGRWTGGCTRCSTACLAVPTTSSASPVGLSRVAPGACPCTPPPPSASLASPASGPASTWSGSGRRVGGGGWGVSARRPMSGSMVPTRIPRPRRRRGRRATSPPPAAPPSGGAACCPPAPRPSAGAPHGAGAAHWSRSCRWPPQPTPACPERCVRMGP